MAFRRKAEYVLAFNPDIVIVPECEHPDKLKFINGIKDPQIFFGLAKTRTKGLVFFHTAVLSLSCLTTIILN